MKLKNLGKMALYLAWVQAIVGTFGSLYFSEIKHFTPCALCWYQRIMLYPLVLIIPAGILTKDKALHWYVLPLSLLGVVIASYQNLLQLEIIPENLGPCSLGVSCTTKYISYFGFITIPLLSLLSFILISLCMLIFKNSNQDRHEQRS